MNLSFRNLFQRIGVGQFEPAISEKTKVEIKEAAPTKKAGWAQLSEPSQSERSTQRRAAEYVKRYGSITLRDIRNMGTNHPAKVLLRLRKAGVVCPKAFDTWMEGPQGRYKVYWLVGGRR